MALEKFHYTFEDGTKVQVRKYSTIPFKTFRKMLDIEDESESQKFMFDLVLDYMSASDRKKVEERPFAEGLSLIGAWANEAKSTIEEQADELGEDVDPK